MLNINIFIRRLILITAVLPLWACGAGDDNSGLPSAEKAFLDKQKTNVLVEMSLKEMFSDPDARKLASLAGNGRVEDLRVLVGKGVVVDSKGAGNATPLFWAMKKRNLEGFGELLRLGANPNVIYSDGGTPMHWGVEIPNVEYLALALQHGGNPDLVAGMLEETPIFSSISYDNRVDRSKHFDLLVEAGANLDFQRQYGDTPLMHAIKLERLDFASRILTHNVDCSIKNEYGSDAQSLLDKKIKRYSNSKASKKWIQFKRKYSRCFIK